MISRLIITALALAGVGSAHRPISPKARHVDLAKKQDNYGYMNVGYYANWVVYQDYPVSSIPVDQYTHLLYSFANMSSEGTVYLSDPYADIQIPYEGDTTSEGDLGGSLKQFYLLKKTHRNLKTMISVGGWTYRHVFANIVNPSWRAEFVRSSVKLVLDLGLDGIDIDYEWASKDTMNGTADLMVELRAGLDVGASEIGAEKLLLSYAAPCGSVWNNLDIPKMDQVIDFWNLMSYEYAGGFHKIVGPTSNLLEDHDPLSSTYSGERCVNYFLDHGATARKLNLGMPLYGTGWNGTEGMYSNWTSRGTGSELTPGFYHNRDLPIEGETINYSEELGTSWTFNPSDGHLVSFDIPRVALQKTKYVIDHGLGGLMWWAVDEDWVEPAQAVKRDMGVKKSKRACKKKSEIGFVHAVEPGNASVSAGSPSASVSQLVSASVSGSSSLAGTSTTLSSDTASQSASSSNGTLSVSSVSVSESSNTTSSTSATSTSIESAVPTQSSTSTSEAEVSQDGIQLNIGRSLVQVAKEGFEHYANGLDTTWNVLGYPSSEYGNVRSGM